MCFGCSKEPSHLDGSFEYPQHMFWVRNKEIIFQYARLSGGLPGCCLLCHTGKNAKHVHTCTSELVRINRLFACCKGGNFNIHIWEGSAISSAKEGKSGFIYNLVKKK